MRKHTALESCGDARSDLLQLGILGPPPQRNLVIRFLDIHEASLLHALPLYIVLKHTEGSPKDFPTSLEDFPPLVKGAALSYGIIVTHETGPRLEGLDVSAGLRAPVRLAEERVPVLNTPDEVAHMNEVDGVFIEGPGLRAVLDFAACWLVCRRGRAIAVYALQLDIRGNPRRLVWRDIGANHLAVRVLVGEVAVKVVSATSRYNPARRG